MVSFGMETPKFSATEAPIIANSFILLHISAAYLAKKRAEGKHYNIALSHAAKKLVRLIFALEKSRQPYCPAA